MVGDGGGFQLRSRGPRPRFAHQELVTRAGDVPMLGDRKVRRAVAHFLAARE
jgi:hypothetical protein